MPPSKTRFVTACQQVLALAVVLAALTPAASVVSLDVVSEVPSGTTGTSGTGVPATMAAYARATNASSVVPATPVDPTVREIPLTASPVAVAARSARPTSQARVRTGVGGSARLVSLPQSVSDYGTIGVTWAHGVHVPEAELRFEARTFDNGVWSGWTPMTYHDEHGPDAGSEEAARARPGTDELLVGNVEQVQVRIVSSTGALPADMKLAVIDPGAPSRTAVEKPALDTSTMGGAGDAATTGSDAVASPVAGAEGDLQLQAATFTPKPIIYSRAQWGADESLRDKSSLHYGKIHAGFVHHTVNANNYTADQVPAIIRGIYAYHTQSRGWSDIGYNFVVDRFGRIWEARYGGVDRPVVGAHTLGYNDYAFAMSAIGNYDIAEPSAAMVQAYGALFAWKLSLHGVDAASTSQQVGPSTFQAINGHRDAGQTACPGRYLYAKLPQIRQLAAAAQRGWTGRELESNLASTAFPDIVVRRASDGQAFVIPTGGLTRFRTSTKSVPWPSTATVVVSPDLTGDGHADAVVVTTTGSSLVYPGDGLGGFGSPVKPDTIFAGTDLLTAVGDLNGDGRNDLVGRNPVTGRLLLFAGGGRGGFLRTVLDSATDWRGFNRLVGTGDVDRNGRVDLLARDTSGRLWRYPATSAGLLGAAVQVPGAWGQYDVIAGFGDFTSDGRPDLLVRPAGKAGYLREGRGDGTFGPPHGPIRQVQGATSVFGGDLAGSQASDLMVRGSGSVVVFRNAGTFDAGDPIPTGVNLSATNLLLNAGDWDRDGHSDLITRNTATGELQLRRGDGRAHFAAPVVIATGFAKVGLLAAAGDVTGDGWPDLVGQPSGGVVRIYPGRGLNGLKPSYPARGSVDASAQIPVGRWDADGAPDTMFRQGDTLRVAWGNGPGGLIGLETLGLDLSPYDWVIGVSNVDPTGHPDLIVRAKSNGYLWLLPGTESGFGPRRLLAEGMGGYDLAG